MTVTSDDAHTVQSFQKVQIPPERLFAAWVDPKLMRTWLFKGRKSEIRSVETDLKVGGRFSIVAVEEGEPIEHFGEYQVIERPRRLMFTLQVPKRFPGVTVVSVVITEGGEGSWMSFAQSGVKKEVTQDAWRQMFRRLEAELA